MIADGYENLIGKKSDQPRVEERQDINDVLPAIDSFYTQATQFITANSVSMHFLILLLLIKLSYIFSPLTSNPLINVLKAAMTFISTAGAISNLGFNAYQQDTINDVLDDLDSKKNLIDSIHNKGKRFVSVIKHINLYFRISSCLKTHKNAFLYFSY